MLIVGAVAFRMRASPATGQLDLPDRTGWVKHTDGPGGGVVIGNEELEAAIMAQASASQPDNKLLELFLIGIADLEIGTGWPRSFSATYEGQAVGGWFHAIECPDGGWLAILWVAAGKEMSFGRDVVVSARCVSTPVAWALPPDGS